MKIVLKECLLLDIVLTLKMKNLFHFFVLSDLKPNILDLQDVVLLTGTVVLELDPNETPGEPDRSSRENKPPQPMRLR